MDERQEPKYGIRPERFSHGERVPAALVNRASMEEIPPDEPIFIFRARDIYAVPTLRFYAELCLDKAHRETVQRRVTDFIDFIIAHPDRMKEPDSP